MGLRKIFTRRDSLEIRDLMIFDGYDNGEKPEKLERLFRSGNKNLMKNRIF